MIPNGFMNIQIDLRVWAKATFSVVRDTSAELRFIVIMLEDITEQKKAQQTLAELEYRFQSDVRKCCHWD